jgi:hypothetical protein
MRLRDNENKKKILLVYDCHSHIVENNLKLLSGYFDVHSYCSINYKDRLSTYLKKNVVFFKYYEELVYLILIFKSYKFDYIFISTGPQLMTGKKGLFFILFYFIFTLIHGRKTLMGIMDIKKYFRGLNNGIIECVLNFIRNKSISRINLIFFETKTLLKNFKKKYPKLNNNLFVNYPLRNSKQTYIKKKSDLNVIKIGICGVINTKRKNYDLLDASIKKINKDKRKKIKLVFLGKCLNDSSKVLEKMRRVVNLEYQKNFIKQSQLEKISSSCDVLISPLKKGFGGAYKGTGSIFDAIAAKKRLILPTHADPQLEFKNFCSYYKNSNDLKKILLKLFVKKHRSLNSKIFTKYKNKNKILKEKIKRISL